MFLNLRHLHKRMYSDINRPLPSRNRIGEITMSRICAVTGKRPMVGNNVSHANNKTKRRFNPNLQKHRFWLEDEKRFVTLRVSAKGLRTIDKKGIEQVLKDIKEREKAE